MQKKIALITGGTGGIGTAICRLAEMNIIVIAGFFNNGKTDKAIAWQEKQAEEGYSFHTQFVDVSNWQSCQACFLNIEETIGCVDILVNNAGINSRYYL